MTSQEIIEQTNAYRKTHGLSELKTNSALMKAAEARAQDMAVTGNFSHAIATTSDMTTPWSFIKKAGYNYKYAGENLATLFPDATSTMEAWKKSPGHNQNLVSPNYSETGVAIVPATYKGQKTNFVIQMFGTPEMDSPVQTQPKVAAKSAPVVAAPSKVSIPVDTRTAQSTPPTTAKPIQAPAPLHL